MSNILKIDDRDKRRTEDASIKLAQRKSLMKLVSKLPNSKEKKILCMRFGFYNERPFSEKEIAKIMKMDPSAVHEIIVNTVADLRLALLIQGTIGPEDIKPEKGSK